MASALTFNYRETARQGGLRDWQNFSGSSPLGSAGIFHCSLLIVHLS
jgi:hypothetical protein